MKLIVRAADYAMTDSITDRLSESDPRWYPDRCRIDDQQCRTRSARCPRSPEISACLHWSGLEFSFRNPRVRSPLDSKSC